MSYLYFFTICILLISCINYVQYKLNFALDLSLKHKIKNIEKVPLSGGIYILLSVLICTYSFNIDISFHLILTMSLLCVLGLFSDAKPNFVPVLRLAIQLLIIMFFAYLSGLEINKTNIIFIDKFLLNYYFNFFFTSFCIIVLLNGSNFVDGVNTNLIGYYIIILFFISKFDYVLDINFLIIILIPFYLYNFFGKCFLGDSGVYVLSILISFFVIDIINVNQINPFFAISLLWYPAFENLFSIIRRFVSHNKIDMADKKHLHSLLYLTLKKKNLKFSNTICGLLLCSYNFLVIYFSYKYIDSNQTLILILIINILLYLISYFKLLDILSNRLVSKI